jgi:hypothetical protein
MAVQRFKDSRGSGRSALYANTPVYPVHSTVCFADMESDSIFAKN